VPFVSPGASLDNARQPLGELDQASGHLDLIVKEVSLHLPEARKQWNDRLRETDEQRRNYNGYGTS
jgi:hypothetical protein